MVAVSHTDAAALMEIVYEGASEAGTEPFPSRVLAAIERLIPSDAFVGYEETEFVGASVAGFRPIEEVNVVGESATPALIEVLRPGPDVRD